MLQWVADVGFMSRVGSNLKYGIVGHGADTIRFAGIQPPTFHCVGREAAIGNPDEAEQGPSIANHH